MAISTPNFLNAPLPVAGQGGQPRTEVAPPSAPAAPPIAAAGGAAPPQQAKPQGPRIDTPFARALAALPPEDRERTATGITPGMVQILKELGLGGSPEAQAQLDAFGKLHLKNSIRLPGVTVTFSPRHRGLVDQIGQEKVAKTIAKLFQLENAPLDTAQSDGPPTGGLV